MNNLGVFDSIQEVWEKYPYGGKENDVLTIDRVLFFWDKYNLVWGVSSDESISSGYSIHSIDGDLSIQNDLHVGGTLHVNNIETSCKGLFSTETALKTAFPTPKDGDWAIVGDIVPGPIWRGDNNIWVNTGEIGGGADIDLNEYVKNVILTEKVEELNHAIEYNAQDLENTMDNHVKDLNNEIEHITPILIPKEEFENMTNPDQDRIYYIHEEE